LKSRLPKISPKKTAPVAIRFQIRKVVLGIIFDDGIRIFSNLETAAMGTRKINKFITGSKHHLPYNESILPTTM